MTATVLEAGVPDRPDTSVGQAFALLDALNSDIPSVGASELARRAGIPKSTAGRLLTFLEASGYVERVGTNVRLGRRLFELGSPIAFFRSRGLRDTALPYLTGLYEQSHQVVHLAVLDVRLVLLNRSSHWAQIEHAAEFNRLVDQFVTNH